MRPARADERHEALLRALVPPGARTSEAQARVEAFESYLRLNPAAHPHIAVAETSGAIVAACICVDFPGRSALLHFSDPAHGGAEYLQRLLEYHVAGARARGLQIVEALLEETSGGAEEALRAAGFEPLTVLQYLEVYLRGPTTGGEIQGRGVAGGATRGGVSGLVWRTAEEVPAAELAAIVQRTYERSQDCPALTRVRRAEDNLACHRAVGRYDPRMWQVGYVGGEGAGVVLLNHLGVAETVELVYMGVVPRFRRQGLGRAVLSRGLAVAGAHGARRVTLAVDASNAPACRLYASAGFRQYARRRVWLSVL